MKQRLLSFFIILFIGLAYGQSSNIDSLINKINSSKDDTSKYNAQIALAWEYFLWNLDTTKIICEDAYQLADRIGYDYGMAEASNWLGYVYEDQGQSRRAIEKYQEALAIFKELNDLPGIGETNNNLGFALANTGKITEGIQAHYKALEARQATGDTFAIAQSLNNLALSYFNQGDTVAAYDLYIECRDMQNAIGDSIGLAASYGNLGAIYYTQGKTAKAYELIYKSIGIREAIKDYNGVAASYSNLAYMVSEEGDNPKALELFDKCLEYYQVMGNVQGKGDINHQIGETYKEMGNLKYAEKHGLIAFDIANQIDYPESKRNASNLLYDVYQRTGRYKKALEMYKLHIAMRDSITNLETAEAAIQNQLQYEYMKKATADSIRSEQAMNIVKEQRAREQAEKERQELIVAGQTKQIIYLVIGLVLLAIFGIFIFNRFRTTQKQKLIIESQKIEVEEQKDQIKLQHDELEEVHRDISDSINYAENLQKAILPPVAAIKENLKAAFVLYKPKHVVSGDFYWMKKLDDSVLIAVADCTGHGVPGAMVSVVCSNALNRSVNEFELTSPAKILDKTRELVIETFSRSGEDVRDGMDICLVKIHKDLIVFSGANNPLWIARSTELVSDERKEARGSMVLGNFTMIEFKANKQPIGLYAKQEPFDDQVIKIEPNDTLFLFSDGYADQFGGDKGKKMKYKPFKRVLLDGVNKQMAAQKEDLDYAFENWKGNYEQADDVCIIGIRV